MSANGTWTFSFGPPAPENLLFYIRAHPPNMVQRWLGRMLVGIHWYYTPDRATPGWLEFGEKARLAPEKGN